MEGRFKRVQKGGKKRLSITFFRPIVPAFDHVLGHFDFFGAFRCRGSAIGTSELILIIRADPYEG